MTHLRIRTVLPLIGATTLLIVTIPAGGATTPASLSKPSLLRIAAADVRGCPDGYLCMYADAQDGGGGYGVRQGRDLNDFRGIDFNDKMSSWVNATTTEYCWYTDINYSGTSRVLVPGEFRDVNEADQNDRASSIEDC